MSKFVKSTQDDEAPNRTIKVFELVPLSFKVFGIGFNKGRPVKVVGEKLLNVGSNLCSFFMKHCYNLKSFGT
jgi:hypothetical protein